MKYVLLAILGLGGGATISAGVFALVTSTGMMSRLAGKTHTGKWVRAYENSIVAGGALFNALYVAGFSVKQVMGMKILFAVFGVFAGIFVGCLAVSLAEALEATAIFSRRIKISAGLSFIVLSAALGKMAGALMQFMVLSQK